MNINDLLNISITYRFCKHLDFPQRTLYIYHARDMYTTYIVYIYVPDHVYTGLFKLSSELEISRWISAHTRLPRKNNIIIWFFLNPYYICSFLIINTLISLIIPSVHFLNKKDLLAPPPHPRFVDLPLTPKWMGFFLFCVCGFFLLNLKLFV